MSDQLIYHNPALGMKQEQELLVHNHTFPVANVSLAGQLTKGKWYKNHGEDSLYQDVVE